MFRGINSATLDAKGRMAVPARFRDAVAGTCDGKLVLTIEVRERCLMLYPLPAWETVQQELEARSNMDPQARLLQRLLIGHATDLEIDATGRIRIPAKLREYASLGKHLSVLGQGNKLEIWSDEQLQQRMDTWLEDEDGTLRQKSDALIGFSV